MAKNHTKAFFLAFVELIESFIRHRELPSVKWPGTGQDSVSYETDKLILSARIMVIATDHGPIYAPFGAYNANSQSTTIAEAGKFVKP